MTVIAFVAWLIWELTESAPHRRPVAVQVAQLRPRHARVVPGLRGVLRQCRAACRCGCRHSWATPPPGPGWWPRRAAWWRCWSRRSSAASLARYDARWLADGFLPDLRISYFMRARYTADASFLAFMVPQLVQGMAMGMFFVAMLTISLDRPAAGARAGGLRPVQLPAHRRRRFRHLAHHHLLGSARGTASVPPGGTGDPVRSGLTCSPCRNCMPWAQRSGGGRPVDAAVSGRATCCRRWTCSIFRLAGAGPDSAVLDGAAAGGGRRPAAAD